MAWNESRHCRLLAGLVPDQFQMCRRNLEVMPSIVRAARQTQSICQKTFADMRWNCSSVQRAPRFGPDLLKGKGCFGRGVTAPFVAPRGFLATLTHSSALRWVGVSLGETCCHYTGVIPCGRGQPVSPISKKNSC